MKTKLVAAFAALSVFGFSQLAFCAEPSDAQAELKALVTTVNTKIQEGKKSEAELAPELKEFDALLAKHKEEKSGDVAQILLMKAMLYAQVFDNTQKATAMLTQLKQEYPDTPQAKRVDQMLESIKSQAEAKQIQKSLADGTKFPDFAEKDLAGKSLAIADYKGKVVLLDFWATWCPPCVREIPNVIKTYEKYHKQGFEIIGISLDKEESKLTSYIKDKGMAWPQYFDGKGWENKLAMKYGVKSIPATFLLDGEGKIIGRDVRGEALEEAVGKALAKK